MTAVEHSQSKLEFNLKASTNTCSKCGQSSRGKGHNCVLELSLTFTNKLLKAEKEVDRKLKIYRLDAFQ